LNPRSPIVMVMIAAAAVVAAVGLALLVPILYKAGAWAFGLIPVLVTVVGLVSCVTSGKPGSTILLWIVIIILAPLLGPILWFAWGRKNT
jgi:hypothetical protein